MKVLYSWLQDYVEIPWSADILAEKLTMAGLEVEELQRWPIADKNIKIGRILDVEPHPNSDHLFLCRTDVGDQTISIVCGAPNTKAGNLVPVALPGAILPGMQEAIQESTIRGVISKGVICSEKELGISDDHSGIMILPQDKVVGSLFQVSDFADDWVIDIFITPNRGDCMSVIGIARDIAALSGGSIRWPELQLKEDSQTADSQISLEIIDTEGCPHYSARIIRDITIADSPQWMKYRLEACGLRSINNIVDITNYVLLEVGQPLHAFDLEFIKSGRIVVRSAEQGETFITLDEVNRPLSENNLLICDGEKPVALAGVMGGRNSEVTGDTKHILLESAFFNQKQVRLSSSGAGLSTEASKRFERGVDPQKVVWANNRAADFMSNFTGGRIQQGIVEVNKMPKVESYVTFRPERCRQILGADIRNNQMTAILEGLECSITEEKENLNVLIPTHRWDLTREIDLVEEVARISGFHKILPKTKSSIIVDKIGGKTEEAAVDYLKNVMLGLGFFEVITPNMGGIRQKEFIREGEELVNLTNPLNEEMAYLRPSLIPGLIDVMEWNKNRNIEDIRIFEIGKVFSRAGAGLNESLMFGGLVTGDSMPRHWSRSRVLIEIYELKGIIETILLKIFLDSYEFICYDKLNLDQAFTINIEKEITGYCGKLPDLYSDRAGDIPIYVFEFQLDRIIKKILKHEPKYVPISRYPRVKRDLVLLVDREISAGEITNSIKDKAGPYLKELELFDLYQGKQIPPEKVSLGFSLSFGSTERTLPENEVNTIIEQILEHVSRKHQAMLRSL